MISIVVIFHSEQGHTKVIAQAIAHGAQTSDTKFPLTQVTLQWHKL